MDGKILDPDGAREHMAAWKGRIDKMAQDTEAMRQRLADLRVTAADPHGLAEVTVDSTGTLVDLQLTDRIGRVTPDVVARAIMTTLGQARNQLADRSKEVIEDTVGAGSPAARAIADSVERHLRTDVDDDQPRPAAPPPSHVQTPQNRVEPPPRRGRPTDDEDDDYDPFANYRG